jgi:predicted CxxxxCH...CXXCH cytochrome family protein
MSASRLALLAALASIATAGCDKAREVRAAGTGECTRCHGDASRSTAGVDPAAPAAPPLSARGARETSARGVGAHQSHLTDSPIRRALACAECHVVPADVSHVDGVVGIAFGAIARANPKGQTPPAPSFDPQTASCSSTHCHGETLAGGTDKDPVWTGTFTAGQTTLLCSSCHGYPPPSHAPSMMNCWACHPSVRPSGSPPNQLPVIDLAVNRHVDGILDVPAGQGCNACHGQGTAAAASPPVLPHPQRNDCGTCHPGYTDTTVVVGTHSNGTVNLDPARTGCVACHGTPGRTVGPGVDANAPAMPPAASNGATLPSERGVGAHEAHVVDAQLTSPISCATCHGAPPADTAHGNGASVPQFTDRAVTGGAVPSWSGTAASCASTYCHGNFTGGNAQNAPVWTGGAAEAACGSCHGTPTNAAPTTDPAHPTVAADGCGGCHVGYTGLSVNAADHVNGLVEVQSNHPASWADPAQHGLAANFQSPDPGQPNGLHSCDACHGANGTGPAGGGSAQACDSCHAPAGFADWRTNCTFCHGDRASGRPVPPQDVLNAAAGVRVGAHGSHVLGTHGVMAPLACTACHPETPTIAYDPGHVDAATATVATLSGDSHGWDRTFTSAEGSGTCAAAACHGANLAASSRGTASQPVWTLTDGSQAGCGACHRAPPADPRHLRASTPASCSACHAGTVSAAGAILLAGGLHVNGSVDLQGATCTSCHGDPGRQAGAGEDPLVAASPPLDKLGGNGAAVGAHAAHLTRTDLRAQKLGCSACHLVPATLDHANGVTNLPFGPLATTGGATPSFASGTCNGTYCHGATLAAGGNLTAPAWGAGPAARDCAACHGNPPPSHAPSATSCANCHGTGYSQTTVDLAQHIDGGLDLLNLSCTSCHGAAGTGAVTGANPVAAAPPLGLGGESATTTRAVGAHRSHLEKTNFRAAAIACADCHAVPTSTTHSDGAIVLTFGSLARTGGLVPAFGGTTCASVYCHGASAGGPAAVTWAGAYDPAATATTLGCSSCHGAPPALPHPQNAACGGCHGAGYSATAVNKPTHVDGTLQRPPAGCTACHGDAARAGNDATGTPLAPAPPVDSQGNGATTAQGVGAHEAHLLGGTLAAATPCGECHAGAALPTGSDTSHANGATNVAFGARAGQGAATPAYAAGTCSSVYCHGATLAGGTNKTPSFTGGAAEIACGTCHGIPPPTGGHASVTAASNCGACHGGGYGVPPAVDPLLHVNGTLDGGGESAGGIACDGCHSAQFGRMNGTVTAGVASRHAIGAVPATNAAPTDSGIGWSAPLATNAAAQRSCVNMCHGDHPHALASPPTATHDANVYVNATTPGTRAAASATSADKARTDWSATAPGGLCLSCHQFPVESGATPARPGVSPAAYDASAHQFTTAAGFTWTFTLHDGSSFDRDCTKCHSNEAAPSATGGGSLGGPHWSANRFLLSGTYNPAGAPNAFACYACHGNGTVGQDRSGKNIATQIGKAFAHPANADAVHDSVAELDGAAWGNALGGKARHASCMDCHDVHQAKPGIHNIVSSFAGPASEGAWGAQLSSNPTFWTAPGITHFTKKRIVAGADALATLCFKCHSSYWWGTSLPPFMASSPTLRQTDAAKEFNPANAGNYASTGTTSWQTGETAGSFHPVLASAGSNLGATGNIKAPWTRTSLMTCADCHASETVADPGGPHGSAASFILKGPNTLWDNTLLATSTGMPNGTFCINCHNQDFTTGRFTGGNGHLRSNHRVRCMNCHSAIVHGAPRPGFLNPIAGKNTAAVGNYADYDAVAPYANPGTGSRLYLFSYPGTNTTAWSQSNCGCNGTGH